jgi:hypothetical protein
MDSNEPTKKSLNFGGTSDDQAKSLNFGGNAGDGAGAIKEEAEVQQKIVSHKEQSLAKKEEDKDDEDTSENSNPPPRPIVASRGGFGARCVATTKENDAETKVFNILLHDACIKTKKKEEIIIKYMKFKIYSFFKN